MNRQNELYDELLEFAFNRESEINSWAWDTELREPIMLPTELAAVIRRLCVNSGDDLKNYNNLQVAGGLNFIFNNSFSSYSIDLLNSEMPHEVRSSVLGSLNILFSDCFAPRCFPSLSQGRQEHLENPLNNMCYMFWDVTPLSEAGLEVLRVMESSLYLENIACVESGLHGLGHAYYKNEKLVEAIIDKFLVASPSIDRQLLIYAANARRGYVQ